MPAMSRPLQVFFREILQAHETAHQWWGNVVTPAGYHDDWLMEALANYTALLYLEKHKGTRTFEMVMEDYRTNLLAKNEKGETVESGGPVVLGSRLESSLTSAAWRHIIYGKGAWIMHMLRRRTGDARFFEMLAELRRRYEWKTVSTDQFRALAARYLPPKSQDPDLTTFFDEWVYGTGIPSLKLSYSVKGSGQNLRLQGTLKQDDVRDDFSVPVPVEIQFGKARTITHIVESGHDAVAFSVPLKQPPTKVTLDPQWSVLRQ
jgi:aminopeptidase N